MIGETFSEAPYVSRRQKSQQAKKNWEQKEEDIQEKKCLFEVSKPN